MKTMVVSIRLDVDLVMRLERFAKEHSYKRSEAVKEAIRQFIDK
jgi:predicted transcriptional regulator